MWQDDTADRDASDLELRQFIDRLKQTTDALEAALVEARRLDEQTDAQIRRVA